VVASPVWGTAFICDSIAARLLKRRGHCRSRQDAQSANGALRSWHADLERGREFRAKRQKKSARSGASESGVVHKLKDSR
jgi:hypothetical protein